MTLAKAATGVVTSGGGVYNIGLMTETRHSSTLRT